LVGHFNQNKIWNKF